MELKLRKVGNSVALIVPKQVRDKMGGEGRPDWRQ